MNINLEELSTEFKNNIKFNYDLKKKNWFNIGGKTKIFYKADNLIELLKYYLFLLIHVKSREKN